MKKNLTEMVFILDRSGSMDGLEEDTIGGFNSFIKKQKKEEGQAMVSTVLFDHQLEVIHDRIDLDRVPLLTEEEYEVGGCTALLDAIGQTIHHIKKVQKSLKKEECPDKTIFIITTDGMENASTEYSYEKLKHLVEKQKREDGWEFLFLGANIDAVKEAGRFGISSDRATNYCCDSEGTKLNYEVLGKAVATFRTKKCMSQNWDAEIKKDFNKRGK